MIDEPFYYKGYSECKTQPFFLTGKYGERLELGAADDCTKCPPGYFCPERTIGNETAEKRFKLQFTSDLYMAAT